MAWGLASAVLRMSRREEAVDSWVTVQVLMTTRSADRAEAAGDIRQVARVEAQVVQRRTIRGGESCGYGSTFAATVDTQAAIVNVGYADGYLRGHQGEEEDGIGHPERLGGQAQLDDQLGRENRHGRAEELREDRRR